MASTTIMTAIYECDSRFLTKIAADYNLDLEELKAKYLKDGPAKAPKPTKEPKPAKEVKAKVPKDPSAPKVPKVLKEGVARCTGLTQKKEQCSSGAVPGTCFCKRHTLDADGSKPKRVIPENQCVGLTASKARCTFAALKGCTTCKRHAPKDGEAPAPPVNLVTGAQKPVPSACGPIKTISVTDLDEEPMEEGEEEEEDILQQMIESAEEAEEAYD